LLCKNFASFVATSPRPCPSTITALYFPILIYGQKGLSAPKVVWINPKHHMQIIKQKKDGSIEYTDAFKHDALEASCALVRNMSRPVAARERIIEMRLYPKKSVIEEPIALYMRDAWNSDGSRANLTIVEATLGDLHHGWKGPLILYSTMHRDIMLSNFHAFIEFCKVFKIAKKGLSEFLRTNL
jgi:hypothetical protein